MLIFQVIQLGELVHDGLAEQRVYALVSGGAPSSPGAPPAVRLLPDTAAARRLLAAPGRPVHFWHANPDSGESGSAFHLHVFCLQVSHMCSLQL